MIIRLTSTISHLRSLTPSLARDLLVGALRSMYLETNSKRVRILPASLELKQAGVCMLIAIESPALHLKLKELDMFH